ncbi:hypothetical protein N1851_003892 [Merluccius polli]|uniref:Uncharacterized protein n=1 Tax=Merluccius polli TaxID=89951 RepID=A0AA47N7T7_MERPO|nr:hypothetical protein N1851_003892 [Merluccius polli]
MKRYFTEKNIRWKSWYRRRVEARPCLSNGHQRKLNHLNCELQGKDKNVTDMIINSKRYCSCIWGLGQGCRKVGHEFEERFQDFDKLQPCVTFISNPFLQVDITCISEQLGETFNLNAGELEMEILTLQNDITLKPPGFLTFGVLWTQRNTKVCIQQL